MSLINTATAIVTFLMLLLIQNTQNRGSAAVQLKLDELIRALEGAHNSLLHPEELTEAELDQFKERCAQLDREARNSLKQSLLDTGSPDAGNPRSRSDEIEQKLRTESNERSCWEMFFLLKRPSIGSGSSARVQ